MACYASMAVISHVRGQRHYPVPCNVSRVLGYMAAAVFVWWGCEQFPVEGELKYLLRAVVLMGYLVVVWRSEFGRLRKALAEPKE